MFSVYIVAYILFSAYSTCNFPNITCGPHDDVRCISPDKMCDGNDDCSDKSDENGCNPGNASCISKIYLKISCWQNTMLRVWMFLLQHLWYRSLSSESSTILKKIPFVDLRMKIPKHYFLHFILFLECKVILIFLSIPLN